MRGRLLIVVVGQLADRARNGDGEPSGGIVIAEDDVGHGGPAFLAEIPAIENRGNVLGDEVDGIRPSMLEEDDGGLAGGEDSFGEIVLIAEEIKVVAIAGMIDGPGFARGLFIAAERKDDDIGLAGDGHGFFDALGVERGIAEHDFIGVPIGIGLRDFAAERVENFGGGADFVLDALEETDAAAGIVAVAAEMNLGGVRSDDGDFFIFAFGQRKQMAFVLQENDGFARGFERELLMLGTVGDFFGVGGGHEGSIKKAGEELHAENTCDGAVNLRFGDLALMYRFDEARIGGEEREFDIHAGVEGKAGSGGVVPNEVMDGAEFGDAEVVGGDGALKTPLAAKDVAEEMAVAMGGNAVNFVVGGHDVRDVALFDGDFERTEEIIADHALGVVAGTDVGAGLGLAVNREVLGGGGDVGFVDGRAGALESADGGEADLRDEVGVLAVSLFGAAPARVAGEIEDRSEALLGAGSDEAMEALDVKEDGDAEAGVVANPFLDGVGVFGHGAGVAAFAGAGDLADAVLEDDGGLAGEEVAFFIDKERFLDVTKAGVFPSAAHLGDFFFEGHAGEEIGDALLDGELGVAVGRRALRGDESGEEQSERERKERYGDEQAGSKGEGHAASRVVGNRRSSVRAAGYCTSA